MNIPTTDQLEILDNPSPGKQYTVKLECTEFTCLCPRTGQPDYAVIQIDYEPKDKIVELKSLKLYLQSYRNIGIFHEAVLNQIFDKLDSDLQPSYMTIRIVFAGRGGIVTTVERERW